MLYTFFRFLISSQPSCNIRLSIFSLYNILWSLFSFPFSSLHTSLIKTFILIHYSPPFTSHITLLCSIFRPLPEFSPSPYCSLQATNICISSPNLCLSSSHFLPSVSHHSQGRGSSSAARVLARDIFIFARPVRDGNEGCWAPGGDSRVSACV